MIEGVTDWQKEKRKVSLKLDLRKLKRNRSLSCSFLNFPKVESDFYRPICLIGTPSQFKFSKVDHGKEHDVYG